MMRRITLWAPAAAAASLALPIAAIGYWPGSWWPIIAFISWTLAVCVFIGLWQRRRHRTQCEKLLAHAQLSTIRTLSHHRHDWMNELQIVYGYLRLGKLDKAIAVVDRIRTRMDQESRISQLGDPELSAYLLSFRTICDTMRLEVEVEEGLQLDKLPAEGERLSRTIIALVNVIRFRAAVPFGGENVLTISLSREEEGLRVVMRYSGELAAAGSVTDELEKILDGVGQLAHGNEPAEPSQQARTMVIHFPLSA
ncbi:Spo0B domain-containing protein [Paenibacillaceae bacterium WGS1546]|uniref:Spo0B domain-containing protein n=1 Tax=Cohnella sp. WGS1546 TaxID=3366810 RepID=UPI00372CFBEC